MTSCVFSSDNTLLATGSNDKTVIIWSIDPFALNGSHVSSPGDSQGSVWAALSRDRRRDSVGDGLLAKSAVRNWSAEDVVNWLSDLGLKEEYGDVFRENEIDGQELLHLTHDTLLTSLKISALGHRNKILRGIQGLRNPLWQHISISNEDNASIPQELICSITHEIMKDPVVAADGYSYERQAIMKWIENENTTSPMTNDPLSSLVLIPNRTLSLLIKKYLTP